MKKRIISIFLALVLLIPPLAVPTSAVAALPGGVALGSVGVVAAPALAIGAGSLVSAISSTLGYLEDHVIDVLDVLVSLVGAGNVGKDKLEAGCNTLNQIAENPYKYSRLLYDNGLDLEILGDDLTIEAFEILLFNLISYQSDINDWHIIYHQDYGYVIANASETFILADSIGRYPYYLENTDLWFTESEALKNSSLHVANHYMLDSLQAQQESLHPDYSIRQVTIRFSDGNRYKVIKRDSPGAVGSFILCDQFGFPYGIPEGNTQMGGDRYYNDDKENQPEVKDEPIVDIDGDLVMQMFPDGSFTWINSVIYDASNKTYNVDASTSYDIENNTYYNYEWHYTYHIDYTSITYIGQTAEYDKYYEYYFDLPDGRSSADLTAEELLALNVAVDVLPYIRSADDTSIRALYHFDGDTCDSSYWSHLGEFKWNKGASITYMDAGVFNGALYLDENEHEFSIRLPSNIGPGDFTIQWRYYQSATPTPVTDSSIWIGDYKLFDLDGSSFYSGDSVAAPISVGQWQEYCLVREGKYSYFYHNGVVTATWENWTTSLGDTIRFSFGSEQQTYKYFDEIRVVNKALYSSSGYTSTSVPFDTNLALVLPDSQLPVADEYWSFQSSGDNLLKSLSLDDWTTSEPFVSGGIKPWSSLSSYSSGTFSSYIYQSTPFKPFYMSNLSTLTDNGSFASVSSAPVYINGGTLSVVSSKCGYFIKNGSVSYADTRPTGGLIIPIAHAAVNDGWTSYVGDSITGPLTFSLVDTEGNVYSVSASISNPASGSIASALYGQAVYDDFRLTIRNASMKTATGTNDAPLNCLVLCIQPNNNVTLDFVYLELVKGSSTDLAAEWVESVVAMDKDDLNTPSLAVRTDLEITGHQIGGVRPSLPEKGLVWAMVESGRITSLQIYNGQAWEQVDGRIWTGARWVPYYAYDLLLLKDLYDIVESDPSLDYIYTEAGFWKWLQSAWGEMMKKLDAILVALGGSSGTSTDETLPGGADNPDTEMDEGWKFIDLLAVLRDGMWSTAKGVVSVGVDGFTGLVDSVSNVGSFFDLYEPTNPDGILGIFVYEGDDLWA